MRSFSFGVAGLGALLALVGCDDDSTSKASPSTAADAGDGSASGGSGGIGGSGGSGGVDLDVELIRTDPSSPSAERSPAVVGTSGANALVGVFQGAACEVELARGNANAAGEFLVRLPELALDSINTLSAGVIDPQGALLGSCSAASLSYEQNDPPGFSNLPATVACAEFGMLSFAAAGTDTPLDTPNLAYSLGATTCGFAVTVDATTGAFNGTCLGVGSCDVEVVVDDGTTTLTRSLTVNVSALSGVLDPTFGNGGFSLLGDDSVAFDIALDSQQRILVGGESGAGGVGAGRAAIWRLTPDGQLDVFGTGGLSQPGGLGADFRIVSVAVDGADRPLAAGHRCGGSCDIGIGWTTWRFTEAGPLDVTFNAGGVLPGATGVVSSIHHGARDIVVQGPWIYSGGFSDGGLGGANPPPELGIFLFDNSGLLGTGFGGSGYVTPSAYGSGRIEAIAVLPPVMSGDPGPVVVAGQTWEEGVSDRIAWVQRILADGSIDPSFGQTCAELPFSVDFAACYNDTLGQDDGFAAVIVLPDGRIVVAGSTGLAGGTTALTLGRLSADGVYDLSFGQSAGEWIETGFAVGSSQRAHDLIVDAAGRLVLLAEIDSKLVLFRFSADGVLDPTFASAGSLGLDNPVSVVDPVSGLGLALDDQGRYVIAGIADTTGAPEGVVWRVLP